MLLLAACLNGWKELLLDALKLEIGGGNFKTLRVSYGDEMAANRILSNFRLGFRRMNRSQNGS